MHLPLLKDLLILLSFSVVIVFLLQRIRLPSILGFLITGIIIGPYGLSLVNAVEQVEVISEIGVILLLFVIGMELSIKQLASIKKIVFISGFLQVAITVAISAVASYFLGFTWSKAVFIGFLFSLSSTAIVLKVLQDRNEMSTIHGRNALGILIFQDIIVVPMMLLTPIMAGQSVDITTSIISLILKSAVVVVITVVSARFIVPRLLHAVAKTQNKELFLLTTMALCFAVAFLTSEAGLSLALGAFLAGLIISESEYSHQATSIILPFRELFTSFFFISVGMLLDLGFFANNYSMILLLVLVVFLAKSIITGFAVAVLKYPPKTVILTALSLFQVGEFAFILSKVGIEYNLLSARLNQFFLAVSITTMLLTPIVMMFSHRISDWLKSTPLAKPFDPHKRLEKELNSTLQSEMENHLIIIGYGINGSNVAKAAEYSKIPHKVIELDAVKVRHEQGKGTPIIFGDASHPHILNKLNLFKARAVVIAVSDMEATRQIIRAVRSISKSVYMLVRTRYVKEMSELRALGADEVIPEEFETSIELFSKVLHNFLIPEDDIAEFVQTVRSDNYELFQDDKRRPRTFRPSKFPDFNITCLRVNRESGKVLGTPFKQLALRRNYGINILSIYRNDELLENLKPTEVIKRGDQLFVHGKPQNIDKFHKLLS